MAEQERSWLVFEKQRPASERRDGIEERDLAAVLVGSNPAAELDLIEQLMESGRKFLTVTADSMRRALNLALAALRGLKLEVELAPTRPAPVARTMVPTPLGTQEVRVPRPREHQRD